MKRSILLIVIALLAGACMPAESPSATPVDPPPDTVVTSPPVTDQSPMETPEAPSYLPKPADSQFVRGNLFIGEAGLILRESFPVQVALELSGELPTPCHQLRVIAEPPDAENRIRVEAYTVVNPDLNCIQVVKLFLETIELGTFPGGHYTVWVNGEEVGEFDT